MGKKLGRWLSPLAAGLIFLVLMGLALLVRFRTAEAGLQAVLVSGFDLLPVQAFARKFVLTLLLPFYLVAALVLWSFTLALTSAFRRGYSHTWKPLEGLLLTASALLWAHLVLWWQVPTSLWLMPGLRALPFWVIFPGLLAASLAYPALWLWRSGLGRLKAALLGAALLLAWSLPPWAPEWLPRLLAPALGGQDATQVLIIGLDGLREDVGQASTTAWEGTSYDHAYTVIPATRLLWHILWGGDPEFYTVGHAPPTMDEMLGQKPLPLIDRAHRKGWRPRFYIDDGGTIGLTGRIAHFDDVVMPAPGWENFVNSNLSSSFPLFAAWENWGRAFPTTNPWAPLDAGLREALRLGRGAKLVMFHSCLAHQPIFLNRQELAGIPRWWTLKPGELEPYMARQQVTNKRAAAFDPRRDAFRCYQLRMEAILKAWEPVWNGLGKDPAFKGATRILFSDHGERFYHVTDKVRLAGVHGYNLDPWETRIMLKVAGPGFEAAPGGKPLSSTVSVLSIRDALAEAIAKDAPLSRKTLEEAYPEAPMRYQTLSLDYFLPGTEGLYRELSVDALTMQTGIAPDGIWFVATDKTEAERAEEVTVAIGMGDEMVVTKPLKAGGAYRFTYQGYLLKSVDTVSEDEYRKAKDRVRKLLGPALSE